MATGGGMREYGVRVKLGAEGFDNLGKLSRGLKDLGEDTAGLDKQAEALGAELDKLGRDQKLIDTFVKQKKATDDAAKALKDAQAAAQGLGREMAAAEAPTKAQATALDKARKAVVDSKAALQEQRQELQQQRTALTQAGLGADNLAAAQVRVRQQTDAVQANITALSAKYVQVGRAARESADDTVAAAGKQAAASKQVAASMEGVESRLVGLGRLAAGGVLGAGTAQVLRSAVETADAYNNLRARISLVTGEGAPLVQAMTEVEAIALRTGSALESTGTLFARVQAAGKDLGLAQADALRLTETINQAVQVSGTGAAASDAAITQLIQGLGSGVLRGEEFNSVMEQAPRLAQALADGLGVTRGELRGLANDGQLSSEKVIQALKSQSAVLASEFEKLPATVGRAVQNLNTSWTVFIGNLDKSTGATQIVAQGIDGIAKHMDELAGVAGRAGAVLVAALAIQGAGALRALATQALASGGAMAVLKTNIDQIPRVVNIAVAVTGLEVGFQIGKVLYENSELARKLGVNVAEFFTELVSELQFLKDAAAAVFTDDTIGQAFDRYTKRAQEQRTIFADLFKDAAQLPEVQRAAAQSAADGLAKTGDAATTAGAAVAAGGAAGAAGVGGIGRAADSAVGALTGLATAAGQKLPQVGRQAAEQAQAMAKLAEKSADVALYLATEIPAAIEKLSGADLALFRDTMQAALQGSEKGAGLLRVALAEVGKQAAQSLGVDVAQASAVLSKEFRTQEQNFAILLRSLPALKAAGVDTATTVQLALAKMVDGAKSTAELEAVRARIEALGKAGQLAEPELRGFLQRATNKARELREQLEDARPGIQGLAEAARKAGVDVALLTGGLTKDGKEAVQTISDLVDQVVAAGVSAERASPALSAALNKRLEAAQTEEEVKLLKEQIDRAAAAGKLFGTGLVDALGKVKAKAEELGPAMREVTENNRILGIKSQAELQAVANTSKAAFDSASASGKYSAQQLVLAFQKMRDDAVAANGGIEPSWIRQRELMVQSKAAAAGLSTEIVKGMGKAKESTSTTLTEMEKFEAAMQRLRGFDGGVSGTGITGIVDSALAKRNAEFENTPFQSGSSASSAKNAPAASTYDTGQAVNRPAGGNWTYTILGYDIGGVDAKGNRLPGGWKSLGGDSSLSGNAFGGVATLGGGASGGNGLIDDSQSRAAAVQAATATQALAAERARNEAAQTVATENGTITPASPGMFRVEWNTNGVIHTTYSRSQAEAEALLKGLELSATTVGG